MKEYFPNEDPIGRQIKLGKPADAEKVRWITIIGVVGNIKQTIVYQEMSYIVPPAAYLPVDQLGGDSMGLIIRAISNPLSLRPAVERAVSDLDKDVPVSDFRTAEERIAEFLAQPRFRTVLLGVFVAIALALAAVGIYGVLSQFVSQRKHEIGIRMALGAERTDVIRLVAGQGMVLGLTGVVVGLAGTLVLTRFLSTMLYGVKATDPMTLAGVAALLLGVALLACYTPARRAAKVDPMVALRHE